MKSLFFLFLLILIVSCQQTANQSVIHVETKPSIMYPSTELKATTQSYTLIELDNNRAWPDPVLSGPGKVEFINRGDEAVRLFVFGQEEWLTPNDRFVVQLDDGQYEFHQATGKLILQ